MKIRSLVVLLVPGLGLSTTQSLLTPASFVFRACGGGGASVVSLSPANMMVPSLKQLARTAVRPQPPTATPNQVATVLLAGAGGLFDSSYIISDGTIWAVRIGSAVASYAAFITFFDRPRGQLYIKLDDQVEIKPSTVPGAGLGLFAKTSLPAGTILGTYPGTVIPLPQNLSKLREYPACEAYVWRFSDNNFVIDPTNSKGVLDPMCLGGNPSMPGSVGLFQTPLLRSMFSVSTALCRINEPPRGMDVNVVTSEDLKQRSVTFALERDVVEGEEFFIDYGLSYDRSMYGGGGGESRAK